MSVTCNINSLTWVAPSTQPVNQQSQSQRALIIDLEKDFMSYFAGVYSWHFEQDDCIKLCAERVMEAVNQEAWDLSEHSRDVIDGYIAAFSKAVDRFRFPKEVNPRTLKADFMKELSLSLGCEWTEKMAQSFYPIPLLSFRIERIAEAQKWAGTYMEGAICLNKMWGNLNFPAEEFVHILKKRSILALRNYAQNALVSVDTYDSKGEEFAQRVTPSTVYVDSPIDEMEQLLIQCVWFQFLCQKRGHTDLTEIRKGFEKIFPAG